MAGANCSADFTVPVLAWKDILFIQPRCEPVTRQSIVEISDYLVVIRGMTKKHLQLFVLRSLFTHFINNPINLAPRANHGFAYSRTSPVGNVKGGGISDGRAVGKKFTAQRALQAQSLDRRKPFTEW